MNCTHCNQPVFYDADNMVYVSKKDDRILCPGTRQLHVGKKGGAR